MKNFDYNINKEYEVKIMSLLDLRDRIMNDFNLTEEDIFNSYTLNNFDYKKYTIGNKKLLSLYFVRNEFNENISTRIRDYSLMELYEQLKSKVDNIPELTSEEDIEKLISEYWYKLDKTEYKDIPYSKALEETYDYNKALYLENLTKEDKHFNQGVENAPVVVNINKDGKMEIIDGFYRILYKKIDRNVIVKIYNDISDIEWMKLMINFNHWKNDKDMFFDRGFLIGLRLRYGIKYEDYCFYKSRYKIMDLLDVLSMCFDYRYNYFDSFSEEGLNLTEKDMKVITGGIRMSLFKEYTLFNKYFISDLKMFKNYINYNISSIKYEGNMYSTEGHYCLLNIVLPLINKFRIIYRNEEMNELPLNLLDILMENKEIKSSFTKSLKISVYGHIENRLKKLIPIIVAELKKVLLK